jgi:hypothetical protein
MTFIAHWQFLLKENITYLEKAIPYCQESGDFQYLGYCHVDLNYHMFESGEDIEKVIQDTKNRIKICKKINQPFSEITLRCYLQKYINLHDEKSEKSILKGKYFNEFDEVYSTQKNSPPCAHLNSSFHSHDSTQGFEKNI